MKRDEGKRLKLVIFEFRQLGDAITSIPFIRIAQKTFDVFVCCPISTKEIYQEIINKDKFILWEAPWLEKTDKRQWSIRTKWGFKFFLDRIRNIDADIAISVWADTRTHILMALSNIPVRFGFPMNKKNFLCHERIWRKNRLYMGKLLEILISLALLKPLLTKKLYRNDYWQPHIEDWHQLAKDLGLSWNLDLPWIDASSNPSSFYNYALHNILDSFKSQGKKIWLIHPGARLNSKRWSEDKFQSLIDNVFVPKLLPLVIIKPPNGPILRINKENEVVIETPTIADLIKIIDKVDCVICNDSLTSHLAAALGKRVITIFGSGSPNWFAPYGNEDLVVNDNSCPYKPCMDRCEMPSYVCLESISVEMVQKAMNRIM